MSVHLFGKSIGLFPFGTGKIDRRKENGVELLRLGSSCHRELVPSVNGTVGETKGKTEARSSPDFPLLPGRRGSPSGELVPSANMMMLMTPIAS